MSQNIEMNYFNGNEYEVLYPTVSLTNTVNSLSATNVSYSNSSTSSIITSNQVQGAIDELFQSVSDGKSLIAEAITDKGVSTSSSANFATMAENIKNIQTKPKFRYAHFTTGNSTRRAFDSLTINWLSEVNYLLVLANPDSSYDSFEEEIYGTKFFLYFPNIIGNWMALWCYETFGSGARGAIYWTGLKYSQDLLLTSEVSDESDIDFPIGIYKEKNILYYAYANSDQYYNRSFDQRTRYTVIGF